MNEFTQIFSYLLDAIGVEYLVEIRQIQSEDPSDKVWDVAFDALVAMGEG
jgi:hypothetical protein